MVAKRSDVGASLREKRGTNMRNLRIAARTIAAALFVAGLTVPFGTALAQSKQPLNFKSVDVPLPGVTFTSAQFQGSNNTLAIKISPKGKVVGCFHNLSFDTAMTMHGFVLHDGDYEEFPMLGSMNNGIARNGQLIVGVVFPDMATFHAYE